jgi:hypothetical protein
MIVKEKICFFINWLRELDMYKETYKRLPKNSVYFVINNLSKSKRNNKNEILRIKDYFEKKNITNYKLLSDLDDSKKFKILISTADLPVSFLSIKSFFRFIYARSFGGILQLLNINFFLKKFIKRDIACGGFNADIYEKKFIEKNLCQISLKFPNGLDRNIMYFPDNKWRNIFDIYLCSLNIENQLIKKKFNNKKTFFIGYPRFDLQEKKTKSKNSLFKEFNLSNKKQTIVCLPNERIMTYQTTSDIKNYIEFLNILSKEFNIILRPHPKLQDININYFNIIKKSGLNLDLKNHRNIFHLLKESDLILADYGNIVMESIYLKKKLVIYKWSKEKKFNLLNDKSNCLDFIIRKELKILDQINLKDACSILHNLLNDEKYERKINILSEKLFENEKIKTDLNKLIENLYVS